MPKGKSLPKDVVAQWPEVFSEVKVQAIPLAYLHSLRILFKNGKIWDVNVSAQAKRMDIDELEDHLREMLQSYEDEIAHVDFRLDVERVKKDIIKSTNTFLKKKK